MKIYYLSMFLLLKFNFRVSADESVCEISASDRSDCHPMDAASSTSCIFRGCCWKGLPAGVKGPWCFFSKNDVCNVPNHEKEDCHPEADASMLKCEARGCCWVPNKNKPYCYQSKDHTCSNIAENQRFDCHPEPYASRASCRKRGCCWSPTSTAKVPYCFYGKTGFGYVVHGFHDTKTGFELDLRLNGAGGPYGGNIRKLKAEFSFESKTRIHVKISDAKNKRYEVPLSTPKVSWKAGGENYQLSYTWDPFHFKVTRTSDKEVVFDTSAGGFIFSDQFIQMSSYLPSNNMYGLGEHILPLRISTNWNKITMFARDAATPEGGVNIYGTHPFYLNINKGKASGVLLLNSNAMDILLQPTPAITYRTIGGILDFYIFTGESPDAVIQEYTEVIGRPSMPPYWSLGFHLCKYGYGSLNTVKEVRKRMRENQIPQDTQWTDIDYMDAYKDFTVDEKKFNGLSEFVDDLHKDGMRYIPIVDPAISNAKGYKAFEDGVKEDIFIKDDKNNTLLGKVWPGVTAFPDFFNPNTQQYWTNQLKDFYKKLKYDGIWIDMNEPSSFVDGSLNGCTHNKYDNPPYLPAVLGGKLSSKTICMNSKHHIGRHYDLHSLYGHSEAVATKRSVDEILGKRSLVLTRSSFVGTGKYAAHWLGDNKSTWKDLYYSISGMLSFNMFGIPMVGADICGFIFDTNEELCSRWMQLGAFYPFSRNHNALGRKDQDPAALGDRLIQTSKNALLTRYTLLPYLYTLLYESHLMGTPVARPLFFEFPDDANTYGIDTQFMWGKGLLISPVLKQGAKQVDAYFPKGVWYSYYNAERVDNKDHQVISLPASFNYVNLHVRGGVIIPLQKPALNTTYSRQNEFRLLVALNKEGSASGSLFLDDGESFLKKGSYTLVKFTCKKNTLTAEIQTKGYVPNQHTLESITVYGVSKEVKNVSVNGKPTTEFRYDSSMKFDGHFTALNYRRIYSQMVELED